MDGFCGPLAQVAEHIKEAERIGLFLSDGMGLFGAVFFDPSEREQSVGWKEDGFVRLFMPAACGVFPFGFGGQAPSFA